MVGAVVAFFVVDREGDQPVAAPTTVWTTPTTTPTTSATTSAPPITTATPTPTPSPRCEGDDTRFNADGTETDSLRPDCGQRPVDTAQQQQKGLGLACGGEYPVILYKSTTIGAKASICGKDTVGDRFRVVIQPDGSDPLDLAGRYQWRDDAWVAKHDGTTFVLHAVDGSLDVTRGGATTTQQSTDWISLDNESDD